VPVILHGGFDPEQVNRALDREGVTLVSVVATMLARLVDGRTATYPNELRLALLGGGPAPWSLIEEARALGIPVAPTYGLTEAASQVTTLLPHEVPLKPGSAGSPLPQAEVRIEIGGDAQAAGIEGEIAIRTSTIMQGYLGRDPQPQDGWFRTGDIGRMDEDGYLTVLDRRDDLIVSGGENVYPAEVEAALATHPAVLEAAVVGLPDERWGSVPIAVIVIRQGDPVRDEDILAWAGEALARYKRPRRIIRVEHLPRTAAGKLLRRRVREIAAGAG
jgi:o-succinylbenzoate---CoA ligase